MDVVRIGIMAHAKMDRDGLPPGLAAWIEHLGRPWKGALEACAPVKILVGLGEAESQLDRCHHALEFNRTLEKPEYGLTLDWQRVFRPAVARSSRDFETALTACREAALAYFDRFAQGDLAYV